jgi:cellulose synthase/poly-beta-1,6-N-acetylglucosamine synthase-like glycosyltransferase
MITLTLTLMYSICALLLASYTLAQGVLLCRALYRQKQTVSLPDFDAGNLPDVLIQLPIYNERYVALRLIDAVLALDYPQEKLHIQILDDSSDNTTHLIAAHLQRYPERRCEHIRRIDRSGYKAGALAYGLAQSDAPFIAIFDADFIPPADFLRRTIAPLLHDDGLALVQTRWGHLNPAANWLTRAQVLAIDTHFVIEQTARTQSGWMIPFNGTGGVWRRSAIAAAGGWSASTLTEDLDLSLRAQLAGWRALYLPDVVVPGELPPQFAAYRQQQARWAKGTIQNLRRLSVAVVKAPFSILTRIMALHHLAQYLPQLLMMLMLLLVPPLLVIDSINQRALAPLGMVGLIPLLMLASAQIQQGGKWWERLLAFPVLMLIGSGLIWSNATAVLSGFYASGGEFRRTPKFAQDWQRSGYALRGGAFPLPEAILTLYALWGAYLANREIPVLVPYLLLHAAGFALVCIWESIERHNNGHSTLAAQALPESGTD